MDLYGSVAKTKHTFNRWYLEMPEFWCENVDFVKKHPYLNIPKQDWGEIDTGLFKFYKLDVDWLEFEKVLDLRGTRWQEKLATFIIWYGRGWSSPGGLWKDTSPLDQILFLGNYNVLSSFGYKWVVLNHGPDNKDNFTELWYYIDQGAGPDNFYEMTKIDSKEFF